MTFSQTSVFRRSTKIKSFSETIFYFIYLFLSKPNLKQKHIFHLVLHQQVENILQEGLSADKDLSFLAVRKENIFLHFISEAKISDDLTQVDLLSYSMNHLDECITNTKKAKNFHNKMQADFKKKDTFLQREDFDAAEFRKVTTNFEALNPGRLVKETLWENQLLFIHSAL